MRRSSPLRDMAGVFVATGLLLTAYFGAFMVLEQRSDWVAEWLPLRVSVGLTIAPEMPDTPLSVTPLATRQS
ncbi:hypothetical protein [Roseomonas elaeocarpi]|uniref:Uncharacterized protein n=1 Tax=Roseomonas elaeocarpi TaxID=907779 RepID=A0ABV6JWJ0_9PROT